MIIAFLGYFAYIQFFYSRSKPLPPEESNSSILIYYPKSNDTISSPLVIKGEARGNWFFEATAPAVLVDWDGLIIAEGYIQANPPAGGGDWMTENFVEFEGTLEFKKPEMAEKTDFGKNGALILKKDNPSGLLENDDFVEIPIRFE